MYGFAKMVFRPQVYNNQRPLLTTADLNNHPLAETYIKYLNLVRYPVDFQTWLKRRENEMNSRLTDERILVAQMLNDPYCRSPAKIRVHKRKAPGKYRR
jgi:hypothetical protein